MVKGKKTPLEYIIPTIDGWSSWLQSTTGDVRTYKAFKYGRGYGYAHEKILKVKLDMKVNGIPLE